MMSKAFNITKGEILNCFSGDYLSVTVSALHAFFYNTICRRKLSYRKSFFESDYRTAPSRLEAVSGDLLGN
jgi:hypothetical protein